MRRKELQLKKVRKKRVELVRRELTEEEKAQVAMKLAFDRDEKGRGDRKGLRGIAEEMGIEVGAFIGLLNEKKFVGMLKAITKAKATLLMNTVAMEKLERIMMEGQDKDQLTAIKMLGVYTGDMRAPRGGVEVNLNIGELYRRMEEKRVNGEVIDLFAIKDGSEE